MCSRAPLVHIWLGVFGNSSSATAGRASCKLALCEQVRRLTTSVLGAGSWLVLFDKILDYIEVPHSIQVGVHPQKTGQPPVHISFQATMLEVLQVVPGARTHMVPALAGRFFHLLHLLQNIPNCEGKAVFSKGTKVVRTFKLS